MDLSPLTKPGLMFWYLGVLPRHGFYCLLNMVKNVTIREIVTNRGRKTRKIYVPSPCLRWVQSQIRWRLLSAIDVEDCVHGFVVGRGTATNARAHAHRHVSWVLNLDLKNFFPTITPARVHGLFAHHLGVNGRVANALARLTTFDGHLCQGFVTSPDIANFVARALDRRLMGLARAHDLVYTRYADDLTFSCDHERTDVGRIRRQVTQIVVEEGFEVNVDKTTVMNVGRRQTITGLVVSEHGAGVPRDIRRKIRAAAHHWREQSEDRRRSIRGWIAYIGATDPGLAARLNSNLDNASVDRVWSRPVDNTQSLARDLGR